MPTRFLHTADWQLGLRVRFIPGDNGAVVRDARRQTVERIAELARSERADFVLVAGDVFEHHALGLDTLRRSFEAMRAFPMPVYLLPGNHDPYTPESLYLGELWRKECPSNVHVLGSREPVLPCEGACLLPCPLVTRHTFDDPTEHLTPDFGPQDRIRIGVAHGGIREILGRLGDDEYEPANAIAVGAAERGALDYLALGDWHGMMQVDARTWYSGTPEATRFKEQNPGQVLLVEIDALGEPPRVTPKEVATLRWLKHEASLDLAEPGDIDRLRDFFDMLPRRAMTLVELTLTGTLDASSRRRLEAEVIQPATHYLRWLRVRDEGLQVLLRDEDLDEIATDGWVRESAQRLREGRIEGYSSAECERALRLLYRLARDAQS